jgi:7,8-dihydroneopterin aldolase/epimerase/oxygenase
LNSNPNSDCLFINQLSVDTSVGVFEWEHQVLQRVLIDVEAECDFSSAEVSDNIKDAISYADVSETIVAVCTSKHHQLLEHMAARICDALFDRYAISALTLSIAKPGAVLQAGSVGIKVKRQK